MLWKRNFLNFTVHGLCLRFQWQLLWGPLPCQYPWCGGTEDLVWTCKKNFSNNITFTSKNYADQGKCYRWLNVIQARLNKRQFWPAVSIMCGWSWALAILQHFCWVIILLTVLSCVVALAESCPQLSLPFGCVLVSICAFLHGGFLCDGAWCLRLTGLSCLPSALACSSLQFHQAPSLHPSVVDGFNKMLPPRSA